MDMNQNFPIGSEIFYHIGSVCKVIILNDFIFCIRSSIARMAFLFLSLLFIFIATFISLFIFFLFLLFAIAFSQIGCQMG